MTAGSWIHDKLSEHLAGCARCRAADPETHRVKHDTPGLVSVNDVPPAVWAKLCPEGASIYRAWLKWLGEPE